MKRLATLLLAAGLLLGASYGAHAVEFKASGFFDMQLLWGNSSFSKNNTSDIFRPNQRMRTKLEIIASENLKGVFQIENQMHWGRTKAGNMGTDSGGALGADGVGIMVKHSYIDYALPNTDVRVRMGLQNFALPGMVAGSAIMDDDVAGIVVSAAFTQNVAATVFWMRPFNDNSNDFKGGPHDTADFLGMTLPLTFDGVKVTPWGMFGKTGSNVNSFGEISSSMTSLPEFSNSMLPAATYYYAGLTGDITMFDPFRLAFDFNYGRANADKLFGIDIADASGYLLSALAEYKLDMMTPGLLAWYASGNDGNLTNGFESMPTISPFWMGTSFGFGDYYDSRGVGAEAIGTTPIGTWGIAAQLKDISFMQDLKHTFRVAFYQGTNDKNSILQAQSPFSGNISNPSGSGGGQWNYLTEKDDAFEVNFNTTYKLYDNLTLAVELGYINVDWSKSTWGDNKQDDAYRAAATFRYAF